MLYFATLNVEISIREYRKSNKKLTMQRNWQQDGKKSQKTQHNMFKMRMIFMSFTFLLIYCRILLYTFCNSYCAG